MSGNEEYCTPDHTYGTAAELRYKDASKTDASTEDFVTLALLTPGVIKFWGPHAIGAPPAPYYR